jgi:hypothetical protein
MKYKELAILPATIVSGLISGYLLTEVFKGSGNLFDGLLGWAMLHIGPGVLFGLATAPVFIWLYKTRLFKALLWVCGSAATWYVALNVFMNNSYRPFGESGTGAIEPMVPFEMIYAGLVGALMLGVIYFLLINRDSIFKALVVAVVGAILGWAMQYILNLENYVFAEEIKYALAFALWQAGIGFILTFDIKKFAGK